MVDNYTFEFAECAGKNEIIEFLETLDKQEKAKIFASIFKLTEILNQSNIPRKILSRYLKKGIYELKFPLKIRFIRLFYFVKSRKIVIFTNGIVRKPGKVPKYEIERAILIKETFLEVIDD